MDASTVSIPPSPAQTRSAELQVEKLRLETKKLRREIFLAPVTAIVPVLAACIAVLGFAWGIYQFNQDQMARDRAEANARQERLRAETVAHNERLRVEAVAQEERLAAESRAQEEEFRQRFWETQLQAYTEICRHAAELAVATNLNKGLPSPRGSVFGAGDQQYEFLVAYWGPLAIIEDKAVLVAMVDYNKCLNRLRAGEENPTVLQHQSYELARACRESLKRTWEPAPLDNIPAYNPDEVTDKDRGSTSGVDPRRQ